MPRALYSSWSSTDPWRECVRVFFLAEDGNGPPQTAAVCEAFLLFLLVPALPHLPGPGPPGWFQWPAPFPQVTALQTWSGGREGRRKKGSEEGWEEEGWEEEGWEEEGWEEEGWEEEGWEEEGWEEEGWEEEGWEEEGWEEEGWEEEGWEEEGWEEEGWEEEGWEDEKQKETEVGEKRKGVYLFCTIWDVCNPEVALCNSKMSRSQDYVRHVHVHSLEINYTYKWMHTYSHLVFGLKYAA